MSPVQYELVVEKAGNEIGRWLVESGTYTIGRSASCSVALEADGLGEEAGSFTIQDDGRIFLASGATPFRVDGKTCGEVAPLRPEQSFQAGSIRFQLCPAAPGASVGDLTITDGGSTALPHEFRRAERYEVGEEIARGGMGAILQARQCAIRRAVAMKVILGPAENSRKRLRFIDEAQITGQLEHPNIVPVHDAGINAEGRVFYTMKLVKGITLQKILDLLRKGEPGVARKYSLPALLTDFQKVCDAVAFAHSRGVIHRDLKPENIMIGSYGEVLVMDWGLARLIGSPREPTARQTRAPALANDAVGSARADVGEAFETQDGTIMGTAAYMAPEQARGERESMDQRSDIFALGVILYELLTLSLPFAGASSREIMDSVLSAEPPAAPRVVCAARLKSGAPLPHLSGREVPESLAAVALRALAFRRRDRYQSVKELQADLTAYQNGFATAAENAGKFKHLRLFIRREKGIFVTAAAAWAVLIALGICFLVKVTSERNRAERALVDLRSTAPTLIEQAQALIEQQKLDDALGKIGFALQIEPAVRDWQILRAQVLQANLQLTEAAAAFRELLQQGRDPWLETNLAVCERLAPERLPSGEFPPAIIESLLHSLQSEGRLLQAQPLAARLGGNRAALANLIEARLVVWRKLGNYTRVPEAERFRFASGALVVNASYLPLTDLEWMRGLPIAALDISYTGIRDLQPLARLRLNEFRAMNTRIEDLSPLRGMPIRVLNLTGCPAVKDFSALQGMPLEMLDVNLTGFSDLGLVRNAPLRGLAISSTNVNSLAPLQGMRLQRLGAEKNKGLAAIPELAGMPLRSVSLSGDTALADVSVLASCPELELVTVPREARGVAALQRLKKLRAIGYGPDKKMSPDEFWSDFAPADAALKSRAALVRATRQRLEEAVGARLDPSAVKLLEDGTWDLQLPATLKSLEPLRDLPVSGLDAQGAPVEDLAPAAAWKSLRQLHLRGSRIQDLSPLAACPQLENLDLGATRVESIAPLHGLPLQVLWVDHTRIADFAPLAGLPLRALFLDHTAIRTAAPLQACAQLEWLLADRDTPQLEALRALPSLVRLSTQGEGAPPGFGPAPVWPAQTAGEFWKEFDTRKTTER